MNEPKKIAKKFYKWREEEIKKMKKEKEKKAE